jgi:hypothetical protein
MMEKLSPFALPARPVRGDSHPETFKEPDILLHSRDGKATPGSLPFPLLPQSALLDEGEARPYSCGKIL